MAKKPLPEGRLDKIEAKDENNDDVPMGRFRSLTRRSLSVSNVELREELARDAKKKAAQRKRKGA